MKRLPRGPRRMSLDAFRWRFLLCFQTLERQTGQQVINEKNRLSSLEMQETADCTEEEDVHSADKHTQ